MNLNSQTNGQYSFKVFYQSQSKRFTLTGLEEIFIWRKNMSLTRTDILAIKSDLAAAVARRQAAIKEILDLGAELREAKRIATQLESTPSQRFQKARDAGKIDPFAEIARQ
jgi:hypothetical protein